MCICEGFKITEEWN